MAEQRERKVILDTETTGKEADGTPGNHRVIEIGCVEMIGRRLTGRKLQLFMNPERPVDEEAYNVHHISDDFLKDQPKFIEVFKEFYDFIVGAELVIHNAKFDVGFLDHEFKMIGQNLKIANICAVTDTIEIARKKYPGQRISLDALCSKLAIDNSARTSHGALLDAEILAEVYLALTGGQENLNLIGTDNESSSEQKFDRASVIGNDKLKVIEPSPLELGDHLNYMMSFSYNKVPPTHLAFGDELILQQLERKKDMSKEEKEQYEVAKAEQIMAEIKNKYMSASDFEQYCLEKKIREDKAKKIAAKEKALKEEQMRNVKL